MKPTSAIAAGALAAFLILSPMLALAASDAVTVSLSASSVSGSGTQTVSGTVTAGSGSAANTAVNIGVTNPSGTTVYQSPATVTDQGSGSGTYSLTFVTGGTSAWVQGTYTVTATYGTSLSGTPATNTKTFTYSPSTTTTTTTTGVGAGAPALQVTVSSVDGVAPGQVVRIYAAVYWVNNGSLAKVTSWKQEVYNTGTTSGLVTLGDPSTIATGQYFWIVPTSGLQDGVYGVYVQPKVGSTIGQGVGSFTVSSVMATASSQKAILSNVSALQGTLASVSNSVNSISQTVAGLSNLPAISTAVGNLQTSITNVQNSVNSLQGLSTLSTNVSDTLSAVQSSQTYVLVVAALAAITLVLELAILVRKLS